MISPPAGRSFAFAIVDAKLSQVSFWIVSYIFNLPRLILGQVRSLGGFLALITVPRNLTAILKLWHQLIIPRFLYCLRRSNNCYCSVLLWHFLASVENDTKVKIAHFGFGRFFPDVAIIFSRY